MLSIYELILERKKMSESSTRMYNPNEISSDVGQILTQQKKRSGIPQIEVVNEIQIVINKNDNQRSSINVPTPSDSKDIRKCISSRSSKTDLTAVTTITAATIETTTKNVTIKSSRRTSREKEKSESNSTICVCGKLLKRVKGLLEKKDKGSGGACMLKASSIFPYPI
ncbi:CLUMA_CG004998, isoform A [Clunio marinus]|uniref:CLUMA_CG004998, isoform A n=1 Tax=Clunio marinus TaxID=568069 RepID=A0A1J1HVE2_9DIPT|nr:CLUMA_CG004998, isoform A [Clunio marinus]